MRTAKTPEPAIQLFGSVCIQTSGAFRGRKGRGDHGLFGH